MPRKCLVGIQATILPRGHTYHDPDGLRLLEWILIFSDANVRLARWQLRLSKFHFNVLHRVGI